MLAQYASQEALRGPIRPFSLARDLAALADLLEVSFGPELRATGSHMVEEMRQMAQWGAMLYLVPDSVSSLVGYVWSEGDHLLGNVSLSREKAHAWTLSNVAVAPSQRGRGIAGRLVDTAIAHVRRHGGRRILLEVRADNVRAIALYAHRGFVRFDTVHEMMLSSSRWPVIVSEGIGPLRTPRWSDSRRLLRLALASTPDDVLQHRPLRAPDFERGWLRPLQNAWRLAFRGQEVMELVGPRHGELLAYGRAEVQLFRGTHRLDLYVHPTARGAWEQVLVDGLLARLRVAPRSQVMARLSISHPEAIQALQAVGFETRRVLDQMALELV